MRRKETPWESIRPRALCQDPRYSQGHLLQASHCLAAPGRSRCHVCGVSRIPPLFLAVPETRPLFSCVTPALGDVIKDPEFVLCSRPLNSGAFASFDSLAQPTRSWLNKVLKMGDFPLPFPSAIGKPYQRRLPLCEAGPKFLMYLSRAYRRRGFGLWSDKFSRPCVMLEDGNDVDESSSPA